MAKSYYPPRILKEAMAIPRTLVRKGGGRSMFRVTIAKELGLGPTGRKFRELITASGGYGVTKGSYIAERIELLDRGRELVGGNLDAVYDALEAVEVFGKFYERFGGAALPSENAGKDFLRDECGVPPGNLDGVWKRLLQDMRDWDVVQEVPSGEQVVPLELAQEQARTRGTLGVPLPEGGALAADPTEALATGRASVARELQVNIAIHIASDTPENTIEAIFRNMEKYLLKHE